MTTYELPPSWHALKDTLLEEPNIVAVSPVPHAFRISKEALEEELDSMVVSCRVFSPQHNQHFWTDTIISKNLFEDMNDVLLCSLKRGVLENIAIGAENGLGK